MEFQPPQNWTDELNEQLTFHWQWHRQRIDGLTDEELAWEPAPGVPGIRWRLWHIIVEIFANRTASHFGSSPIPDNYELPSKADEAVADLDRAYAAWVAGVAALDDEGLARPVGPAEGPWAEFPMRTLVLHINREFIHHYAEIALLRDLWAAR